MKLLWELRDAGERPRLKHGNFHTDQGAKKHYWLVCRRIAVDITGSQFNHLSARKLPLVFVVSVDSDDYAALYEEQEDLTDRLD